VGYIIMFEGKEEKVSPEISAVRKINYPIHPLIQNRWSPRSMTGERMTDEELMPLFEAARWAPSSFNNQPWRFLYAKRNTPNWDIFFDLLIDFNKSWTKNAAALVLIVSRKTFEHNNKPSSTHSFDTGAAWMSLALEGTNRGYVIHGMEGFDYEKAKKALEIPEDYKIEAMVAIGKRASKEQLPEDLQSREFPSKRKMLNEIICEGKFKSLQ
jgi:nitroreductase